MFQDDLHMINLSVIRLSRTGESRQKKKDYIIQKASQTDRDLGVFTGGQYFYGECSHSLMEPLISGIGHLKEF